MALQDTDLLPLYRVTDSTNRKISVAALLSGTSSLWEEDGTNLYPKNLAQSVGIGTDSPSSTLELSSADPRLTIRDTGASARYTQLRNTNGNTYLSNISSGHIIFGAPDEKMRIQDNGSVGIGTDNPQALLTLKPSANVSSFQISQSNSNDGYRFHVDGPNGGHLYIKRWASDLEDTKVALLGNGNVGIGTDNPFNRLHVVDASATGIRSQSGSAQGTDTNKALHVSNGDTTDTFNVSYKGQGYFAGNVGIGEENPQKELHVNGTVRATVFDLEALPALQ